MIPVTPRTSQHFCDWCKEYQFNGTVQQPGDVRYGVGVYQIAQGMQWKVSNPVRWQSFCSAAMHFTMAGYAHGIDMAAGFPDRLSEFGNDDANWQDFMFAVCHAQQQVTYCLHYNRGTTRYSRYSADALHLRLNKLVAVCFSFAPAEYREQGCFDEMKILCHDLPAFTKGAT
jgi:hypothetical protein